MTRKVQNLVHRLPAVPKQCGGKNVYRSRVEAETVAREQELLSSLREPDVRLDVYHCALCGGWHLTSKRD
jgi:hypothetical protein